MTIWIVAIFVDGLASTIPQRPSECFSVNGFVPLTISPPAAASPEMTAALRSEDDMTIEIGLPNGRRLTIPA
ncbi:hypothetical protein [Rhizobium esperanzae]|uniref:hypothetical protein n=1 Tax=Rhizobium esperanzae TaxID=1967781 RepID=UPI001FDA2245|nr:hypothetical protein [Rhizobium esperanzae]